MSLKKYVRQNMYGWHRTISLIIALPVVMWAASGFLHPIMTNVRPKVLQQSIATKPVDTSQVVIPLSQALAQHKIDSIKNIRFVTISKHLFYQIELPAQKGVQYISTETGNLLYDGDEIYAKQLAASFLQGTGKTDASVLECCSSAAANKLLLAATNNVAIQKHVPQDWCEDIGVKKNTSHAMITAVEKIRNFNDEYKYINRLLPVYKVQFDRSDDIRVYVATTQDKFAFAMDKNRAAFDNVFSICHNWSWLNWMGKGRLLVLGFITALAFCNTLLGLYIFFTTKWKPNNNGTAKTRKAHRFVSLAACLFTLLFTFSGSYHAFTKFIAPAAATTTIVPSFASCKLPLDINKLLLTFSPTEAFLNISIANCNGEAYWQVYSKNNSSPTALKGDLMKDLAVTPSTVRYINAADYSVLENGEQQYAQYLAANFSYQPNDKINSTTLITKFTEEYGFINKRLPVWKVQYKSNSNERYYVETTTGSLASRIDDKDLYEGYSFALFHKHHFMDFAGKFARDISTMFWAFMQIAMVVVGLALYYKLKVKKRLERKVKDL